MGSIAKNEVTEDSRRIIDVCRDLVKRSGITNSEFYERSGMRNNYWHVRLRYEAPLTTTDVEHIASTFGLTSLDIYTRALGSEAARAYEARERESRRPRRIPRFGNSRRLSISSDSAASRSSTPSPTPAG